MIWVGFLDIEMLGVHRIKDENDIAVNFNGESGGKYLMKKIFTP